MKDHPLPQEHPIKWDDQGLPHSLIFDDKYFCKKDGYKETQHVSCEGNHLRERFFNLDPQQQGTFTIIEMGFGTGLSFCAAWQLWEQCAPSSWTLNFISIELYPLPCQLMERALNLWPELSKYKEGLLAQYAITKKVEQISLNNVRLTLIFDEVVSAIKAVEHLKLAPHGVDAWFLNGFAPSKSPLMWRDEVFASMAPLSRPGTTLSTFTVAGFVRRGLEHYGFEVEKTVGFGEKKHILVGRFKA